jgi:TolA-binding protein
MMQTPVPPLPTGLDPNFVFNQVAPIIAVVVVVLVCTAAVRAIFRSPVGEALAERIRQRSVRRWGGTGEDPQRVAALEAQLSQLQGQISELAERLDFAERMLAERRERKLGAGQ